MIFQYISKIVDQQKPSCLKNYDPFQIKKIFRTGTTSPPSAITMHQFRQSSLQPTESSSTVATQSKFIFAAKHLKQFEVMFHRWQLNTVRMGANFSCLCLSTPLSLSILN
jgi:hypothetical protein